MALTDEELAEFADEPVDDFYGPELRSMAVELRARRIQVEDLENQLAAAADVIADMEG